MRGALRTAICVIERAQNHWSDTHLEDGIEAEADNGFNGSPKMKVAYSWPRRLRQAIMAGTASAGLLTTVSATVSAEAMSPQELATNKLSVATIESNIGKCLEPGNVSRIRQHIENIKNWLPNATAEASVMNSQIKSTFESIGTEFQECMRFQREAAEHRDKCHGDVRLGMTQSDVLHSYWCLPNGGINTTETHGRTQEQWVYRGYSIHGISAPSGYLYFTNGRLTAIQRMN